MRERRGRSGLLSSSLAYYCLFFICFIFFDFCFCIYLTYLFLIIKQKKSINIFPMRMKYHSFLIWVSKYFYNHCWHTKKKERKRIQFFNMGINCHSFLTGVMTFFSLTFFAHFRKKGKRIEFFSMGMNCHSFLTGGIIVFFLFCSGRAKPQRTTYGLIATTYSAQTEVQENGSFFVYLDMYLENKPYRFFIRFVIFT